MAFEYPDLIPQRTAALAADRPADPALLHVDGTQLTWREAHDGALAWAAGLASLGVDRGEAVVTIFVNSFDSLHAWLGCSWAGAIESPVNTNYKGDWLRHVINNTGATVLVAQDRFVGAVFDVAGQLEHIETVVVFGDNYEDRSGLPFAVMSAADFLAGGSPQEWLEPEPWDLANLIYTSGTTGRSKAVQVPWAHYQSSLESGFLPTHELDDMRLYAPYPVFHLTGKGAGYMAARSGEPAIIREAFSVSEFWHDIKTFEANTAIVLGPLAQMLLNQPEQADDADNPMRSIAMVPVIPEVEVFAERFDVEIFTTFNMTEINCPIVQQQPITRANHRSCGQVRPGVEVRIVDEHDQMVPPNTPGELIMRAEPWEINTGYWNMPDKTAEAWRNGWFHTGDAFTYDEDGNHYFVDRAKDYIRRRGENISSFEVEAIVNEFPAVIESGACAVAAEEGEDEVKVAVVVDDEDSFDPAALIMFLAERMPRFAIPRFVEVWPELPKTEATARIQKAKIRDAGVSDQTWDRVKAGVSIPR